MHILYQDDFLIVVNKPNNMLVYPSYYARNIKDETLVEILEKEIKIKLYPLHRLDRKTSGVILFGKSKEVAVAFQELFSNNQINKTYKAIVRGFCDEKGEINSPIKNDKGIYKEALTLYNTLQTYEWNEAVKPYDCSRYSLVELYPKTGRMHQLRKHMNKISHPIIGDHKYGDRNYNKLFTSKFEIDNLYLHASQIEFIHTFNKKLIQINAPIPLWWNKALKQFNWH